jgi:hypothetical protein
MKLRDYTLTVTTSYATAKALADADTDHSGQNPPDELVNVTITNDTDVSIYVKNSGKTGVTGIGRTIATGASFNYLKVELAKMNIKAASSPTGRVIITGYLVN